jgi:hypothetical protein
VIETLLTSLAKAGFLYPIGSRIQKFLLKWQYLGFKADRTRKSEHGEKCLKT